MPDLWILGQEVNINSPPPCHSSVTDKNIESMFFFKLALSSSYFVHWIKGDSSLKWLKSKQNNRMPVLTTQGQNKTNMPNFRHKMGLYLPLACFPRALPISYPITEACFWKDSGGSHFPRKPGKPHFYVFTCLAMQCTKTPREPEAEIVAHFWPAGAGAWEHPVTGAPMSVLVWAFGHWCYLREKERLSHFTPKRISIKMSFQVFTVNLLIPFCSSHQTTNFQPLKWVVGSISHEFFLTTDKSCTCVHTSTQRTGRSRYGEKFRWSPERSNRRILGVCISVNTICAV